MIQSQPTILKVTYADKWQNIYVYHDNYLLLVEQDIIIASTIDILNDTTKIIVDDMNHTFKSNTKWNILLKFPTLLDLWPINSHFKIKNNVKIIDYVLINATLIEEEKKLLSTEPIKHITKINLKSEYLQYTDYFVDNSSDKLSIHYIKSPKVPEEWNNHITDNNVRLD